MKEETKKYKIDAYLFSLTVKEYRSAMHILPKILDISLNTFHNYRKINIDEEKDIPYEKVVLMEHLFALKTGELTNRNLHSETLKELVTIRKFSQKTSQIL